MIYLPDIVDKYQTEDTTFTLKKVSNPKPTIPSVTICSMNKYKMKVVKEATGSYRRLIWWGNVTLLYNISLPELHRKSAFLLNSDFHIESYGKLLKLGRNYIYESMNITVHEMPTLEKGMCYSLIFQMAKFGQIQLAIFPNSTQQKGMFFYLSSEKTISNIIEDSWNTVKPFTISKKFTYKYKMRVDLEETLWEFYKGEDNGSTLEQCFDRHDIIKHIDCMPFVLSSIFPSSSIPLCITPEENSIAYGFIQKAKDTIECSLPATDVEFNALVKDDENFNMKNPQNVIIIKIEPRSSFKMIKKEVLIHDTASLIGSLGGFLGLLIGFSFFGVVSFIIDKLDWLCQSKMR